MYNHILYLTYWASNASIIFLFNKIFPDYIVLGLNKFNNLESAIYAGFWVTFIYWVLWDLLVARNIKLRNMLVEIAFFVSANAIAIFVVSRFDFYIGFSVASYHWLISLGVVMYAMQYFVFKKITAPNSSK